MLHVLLQFFNTPASIIIIITVAPVWPRGPTG